jgi:hypothetical protein
VPSGIGRKCRLLVGGDESAAGAKIPKSCHAQEEATSPVMELWQSQVVDEEAVHNIENAMDGMWAKYFLSEVYHYLMSGVR